MSLFNQLQTVPFFSKQSDKFIEICASKLSFGLLFGQCTLQASSVGFTGDFINTVSTIAHVQYVVRYEDWYICS